MHFLSRHNMIGHMDDMPSKESMRFVANYFLLMWVLLLIAELDVIWGFGVIRGTPTWEKLPFIIVLMGQAILLGPLATDIAKPPLHAHLNIVRHLKEGRQLLFRSASMLAIWVILLGLGVVSPPVSPASMWINRLILLAIATLPTMAWHLQFGINRPWGGLVNS